MPSSHSLDLTINRISIYEPLRATMTCDNELLRLILNSRYTMQHSRKSHVQVAVQA